MGLILKSIGGAVVGASFAAAAFAESERLQPDFTFRRVGVPPSGSTTGRISVQIDPEAPSAYFPPAPDAEESVPVIATSSSGAMAAVPRAPANVAWFWETISPSIADTGPGRLNAALGALNAAPEDARFSGPALQGMSDLARSHGTTILRETVGTNVSPALVLAVIAVESGGRSDAESGAGAGGLMQLMPDTASRFGVENRFDAVENIRGGVAYLDWLMQHFDGDPILVLAGYNAGEGSVRDNAGVPPYAETRAYVPKVIAAWKVARGLCVTPPELISDGCVFAVRDS
ncbi:lytic transglycosylase domain-containing protein [Pelagovum pacificum]|uniref:Lytic transglycosylase domain-containing protein n=1 Tax=Pelagovum pacificum TaxID=2588711 RepID=A0A5C5GBF1_9RHOB|nr:lytic transglycosylase domain-containing protein [Pelagovum pacificum]QQA41639.1 lytic transglycosylase domain-containing protein [Pelagovum pacificum]TNY30917.1 lytic transglycosylase domain-containing protein [Pelagovum pacificum]